MASNAMARYHRTATPQSEPLNDRQVANSAGGYSFPVDDWTRLDRFLILGTDGGTYYTGERDLTKANLDALNRCLDTHAARTIARIVKVSQRGLAPRNSQAIYALAAASARKGGDHENTRRMAYDAIGDVCRTGTHLFEFMAYRRMLGAGDGAGLRRGIGKALGSKDVNTLALHAVKYRQRHGWTYRDLLRVAHVPSGEDYGRDAVHEFMCGRDPGDFTPAVINAYRAVSAPGATYRTALAAIREVPSLPWEAIPSDLRTPKVWEHLVPGMPIMATMRQLATLARKGLLTPMGDVEQAIVAKLTDETAVKRSRIHPMHALEAQLVHASGGRAGRSRGATYTPNQAILDALDETFHLAVANVVPAGKRTYIGLDVSASMSARVSGSDVLDCRTASAAMATVTVRTEPLVVVRGFTLGDRWEAVMKDLNIGKRMTVRDAVGSVSRLTFGGTDCALPMIDALQEGMKVDTFVVFTDSETWAGDVHPTEALRRYRESTGIDARLIVAGMASNGFSIADPEDAGMLDVVGFSADAPATISAFSRGDF